VLLISADFVAVTCFLPGQANDLSELLYIGITYLNHKTEVQHSFSNVTGNINGILREGNSRNLVQ